MSMISTTIECLVDMDPSTKITRWFQNGQLHREDGPAMICPYGSQYWFRHGLAHREDGPAVITSTYEEWKQNDKLHRIGGPAYIHYYNNNVIIEHWYLNGKLHRGDGPAVIQGDFRSWYRYGELHRTDGPAVQAKTTEYYYLFDTAYTKEKLDKVVKILKKFNEKLKQKYREKIKLAVYNNINQCQDVCAIISKYCI